MSKSRTWIIIIVIAAVGAALVFLLKPKAAEEREEVKADMAVHTGTVARATLHRTVSAYGSVEPEPAMPEPAVTEPASDPSADEPAALDVPAIEADSEPDAASETTPGA